MNGNNSNIRPPSNHELRPLGHNAQNIPLRPSQLNQAVDQAPLLNGAQPVNYAAANQAVAPKPSVPRKPRIWPSIWSLEISSAILSVLCLIATIIVLNYLDGKELRQWQIANVSVSPNTLIAIFTTIAKSSMMLAVAEGISQLKWTYFQQQPHSLLHLEKFDDASRGPLGAVKLLGTLRLKVVVVSVGALVTVLALAIDPFTQQVLSYPVRTTALTNETSSIPRTDFFNGAVTDVQTPSPELRSVLRGMYSGPTDVNIECQTGNCTWPAYDTLGICSTCIDTSEQTSVSCKSVDTDQCGKQVTFIPIVSCLRCTYTMPVPFDWVDSENLEAEVMYSSTDNKTFSAELFLQSNTKKYHAPPIQPQQYFLNVMQISATLSNLVPLINGLPRKPVVTSCDVSLCSQWYLNSKFANGQTHCLSASRDG